MICVCVFFFFWIFCRYSSQSRKMWQLTCWQICVSFGVSTGCLSLKSRLSSKQWVTVLCVCVCVCVFLFISILQIIKPFKKTVSAHVLADLCVTTIWNLLWLSISQIKTVEQAVSEFCVCVFSFSEYFADNQVDQEECKSLLTRRSFCFYLESLLAVYLSNQDCQASSEWMFCVCVCFFLLNILQIQVNQDKC